MAKYHTSIMNRQMKLKIVNPVITWWRHNWHRKFLKFYQSLMYIFGWYSSLRLYFVDFFDFLHVFLIFDLFLQTSNKISKFWSKFIGTQENQLKINELPRDNLATRVHICKYNSRRNNKQPQKPRNNSLVCKVHCQNYLKSIIHNCSLNYW